MTVPRLLQERTSLSRAQVTELAKLVVELEEKVGQPVDIETAFAGDLLYLLQCRPITTLDESSLDTRANVQGNPNPVR